MYLQYFFLKNRDSSLLYNQIFDILKFENIVKFKICSLAQKLYNNPSTVAKILHNLLTPVTSAHSYNTRKFTKYIFKIFELLNIISDINKYN